MNFIRTLLSQSTHFSDSKIFNLSFSKLKKLNLIILIVILLNSASILTKAFTGLLLNTYANVRHIPVADSFEDIYQDQSLEVHSRLVSNVDYLKNILKMNPQMIDYIVEREEAFRQKYDVDSRTTLVSSYVFEKIVTGKLIVICITTSRTIFETKFIKWKEILVCLIISTSA